MSSYGLAGKTVLVTGGGSGIGKAVCEEFASHEANVVTCDLDVSTVPERTASVVADLIAVGSAERVVEAAIALFGGIDVLVNNVGVATVREGFLSVTDDDWYRSFTVNVMTTVRMCRSALPSLVERRGVIVNIASVAARQPDAHMVDYGTAKAAILSVTKSLANEFGPRGVRVNSVSPGPTLTPALTRPGSPVQQLAADRGVDLDAAADLYARSVRRLPLGRLGRPVDVANAVVFLASMLAEQITGSDFAVNGGGLAAI